MARGGQDQGVADDILYGATDLRARSRTTEEKLVGKLELDQFKSLAEHGLPQLRSLTSFLPVYRGTDGDHETRECSEMFIGSDDQIYILHFRDSYQRQKIGRKRLVAEECAISYQGRKIAEAVKIMNAEMEKASTKEHRLVGFNTKIAGFQANGRNPEMPYRVDEIVERLDGMLPKPKHDPRKRVEQEFALIV